MTILVIHDDDRKRDAAIVQGICSGGTEIEHEMPDRVILTIPIHNGPDLPGGNLFGSKIIYEREAKK